MYIGACPIVAAYRGSCALDAVYRGSCNVLQGVSVPAPYLYRNFLTDSIGADAEFSRPDTIAASYYDRNGVMRYAAANEPRFTYFPTHGLLLERDTENLCLESEDFTAWPEKTRVEVIPGQPNVDHQNTAFLLRANTTGVNDRYSIAQSTGLYLADTTYASSIHYKRSGTTPAPYLVLWLGDWDSYIIVDTLTNEVVKKQNGALFVDANVETGLTNGWNRVCVGATTPATSTMTEFRVGITVDPNDPVSNIDKLYEVYISKPQAEAARSYPSSYIATTVASVQRPQDKLTYINQAINYDYCAVTEHVVVEEPTMLGLASYNAITSHHISDETRRVRPRATDEWTVETLRHRYRVDMRDLTRGDVHRLLFSRWANVGGEGVIYRNGNKTGENLNANLVQPHSQANRWSLSLDENNVVGTTLIHQSMMIWDQKLTAEQMAYVSRIGWVPG